ncbi:YbaK/EbsC family protein [Flaviflexus equikiangi]|uniref:YbaK/EbsC family protein n=1 Tax=Flaviflexus equikiangi TaxID=2758573 RepID=UPI0015F39415|nr:YbaK/EbsC family protein [Flaviflexus equikiangi]
MTPHWVPALDSPRLLAPTVYTAISSLARTHPEAESDILVAELDPELADTSAMTEAWGTDLHDSVNCVIVAGRRDGVERIAACCVRATTRANINHTVKRRLDVRKCSFLHMEAAVERTGMEYGGITPLGLDPSWPIWLDPLVTDGPAIIGSGLRISKIKLPGSLLAAFPGIDIVPDLAVAQDPPPVPGQDR